MQSFKKLLSWLWKTFWGFPLWIKVAISFFIIMMADPKIALNLVVLGACVWAIQHMFMSILPKKGKKK